MARWIRWINSPRARHSEKSDNRDAIRFVNFDNNCRLEKGRVKLLPGWRRISSVGSQPVEGKLKRDRQPNAGRWYISLSGRAGDA